MCSIIDFSFSRLRSERNHVQFCNLVDEKWLFEGDSNISSQYQVYRDMRSLNNDNWSTFLPGTNVLWLKFVLESLLLSLHHSKKKNNVYDHLEECLKRLNESDSVSEYLSRHKFIKH